MKTFLNKPCALLLGLIFLISINFCLANNLNVNVRVIEDLDSATIMLKEPAIANYSFFEKGISYFKTSRNNLLPALAILLLIFLFVIFIKLGGRRKND